MPLRRPVTASVFALALLATALVAPARAAARTKGPVVVGYGGAVSTVDADAGRVGLEVVRGGGDQGYGIRAASAISNRSNRSKYAGSCLLSSSAEKSPTCTHAVMPDDSKAAAGGQRNHLVSRPVPYLLVEGFSLRLGQTDRLQGSCLSALVQRQSQRLSMRVQCDDGEQSPRCHGGAHLFQQTGNVRDMVPLVVTDHDIEHPARQECSGLGGVARDRGESDAQSSLGEAFPGRCNSTSDESTTVT